MRLQTLQAPICEWFAAVVVIGESRIEEQLEKAATRATKVIG